MTQHTIYACISWDGEDWDMVIDYEVTSYSPGYAGDFYEPPSGSEYEFKIINISHDLPKGSTSEIVQDGLRNLVEIWFESDFGQEKASQQADDDRYDYDDDYYDD